MTIATEPEVEAAISRKEFGALPDGRVAELYTLTNASGMQVQIASLGGAIVSLHVPDRNGVLGDVVLGYAGAEGYAKNLGNTYFGALIGRYANRIAKGRFNIDGRSYQLDINDGANSLHGGDAGFNKVVWSGDAKSDGDAAQLVLQYESVDGAGGYPGNLSAEVVYTLLPENSLRIDYTATTDGPTIVNLTNHSYFNLNGEGDETVLPSLVTIDSDFYTPVDEESIPTGEIASVEGTPFDFRSPTAIGERIGDANEQLRIGRGYDHNWVLNRADTDRRASVRIEDPRSGRILTVRTTQPGVQFYTGNQLDGSIVGKSGRAYARNCAFVVETQHFPDSPNHPNFPGTELTPGQTYHEAAIFEFGVAV